MSNSSTSLTEIDKVVVLKLVSLDVARIVMLWLVAVSASRAAGHGHNTRVGIDGEQTTGIIIQASR